MAKILFAIKIHSVVDVITNSSSELFVGKSTSKQDLESLIKETYPEYTNEYELLQSIDELTPSSLNTFMYNLCSAHSWPHKKENLPVPRGFTFDELYEPEDDGKPAWNGSIQYRLRRTNGTWEYVVDENFEEIKRKLDPNKQMFFLWSHDDNPNWDYQEKLEKFMDRYHLG